jgi:hypothetical protein
MERFDMIIKASAGSALILAAGLLIGFAGPSPAMAAGEDSAAVSKSESATPAKSVRHGSRYLKKHHADGKSTHAASKSDESKKAEEKQVADASGTPAAMPAWLANANAQMTAADAPPDSAKGMSAAMSEKASTVLQAAADKPADAAVDKPADAAAEAPADAAVVAPDQLNDGDRALHPSSQTVAMATAKPAADGTAQAANNDSSTLDRTSLIGKIFIAFGALLTMASAARMFMA